METKTPEQELCEKLLNNIFEDLEKNAIDHKAYRYWIKEANQVIRSHFELVFSELVSAPLQKMEVSDEHIKEMALKAIPDHSAFERVLNEGILGIGFQVAQEGRKEYGRMCYKMGGQAVRSLLRSSVEGKPEECVNCDKVFKPEDTHICSECFFKQSVSDKAVKAVDHNPGAKIEQLQRYSCGMDYDMCLMDKDSMGEYIRLSDALDVLNSKEKVD